ncbi:hypothetical protein DYI37_03205 [Fulvimarina endophytica]|uniref:Uncharacterized protein n=1 Tax=Fulvimarina endophytica TaxID=2293836 RepID=A0A371XB50_9HYPH|nr:hypothetical protein [Fulvimarina endophytica]RFC66463.1 hypothetical protein DYI37_03205 [Fulvimarina endophytica]
MRDISNDAELIADMIPIVKARFVEAIDTADHAYSGSRPAQTSTYWPPIANRLSTEDDETKQWRPSRDAISRADEVLQRWLLEFLDDIEHRRLVMAWASSIANPRRYGSFAKFCRKSGRVRRTADRRLQSAFSIVAALINKNSLSLQDPDAHRVSTLHRVSDMQMDKVAEDRLPGHPSRSGPAWRSEDAASHDDPEQRDLSWSQDQNERRRRRTVAEEAEGQMKRAG